MSPLPTVLMNHWAWAGARTGVLLVTAGLPVLVLAACNAPSSAPVADIASFTESDSAYAIRGLIAQLDIEDERALFGSVTAVVENADGGYVAADGLNRRLVFTDRNLNPLRTVGRHGEGPGEYQLPGVLIRSGDQIAVVDQSHARVTYLTSRGDFVRVHQVGGFLSDATVHPELGLLVVGMEFSDHYLARVAESGQTAFAEVPVRFRDQSAVFQLPIDLVATTPDGRVHVLDGSQLVLASYDSVGNLVGLAYLPEPMRTSLLERDANRIEALGGTARVLGSQLARSLQVLEDGRLFVRITYLDTVGLVLDLNTLRAIPVRKPDGSQWDWIPRTGASFFDGARLVMEGLNDGPAALVIAETELVAR